MRILGRSVGAHSAKQSVGIIKFNSKEVLWLNRRPSKKRRYRRKKIRQISFVMFALIVVLVVLLRNEITQTISGSEVGKGLNESLEKVFGQQQSTKNNVTDRWSYVSDYESLTPIIRDYSQISAKLKELSESHHEFKPIYENMSQYPQNLLGALCNNPDMIDFVKGYLQADATKVGTIEKKELTDGIPLFIQWDTRWGYVPYGDDNIALSGCAPTCLSMVIVGLTGDRTCTPAKVAQYSTDNNYYIKGTGTQWKIMTEGCLDFGVRGRVIALNRDYIYDELENGHPIICSMSAGDFTTAGHFIVLSGIKDNKIIVNDPNSKVRSGKLWDYETLQSQIKNLWAFSKD